MRSTMLVRHLCQALAWTWLCATFPMASATEAGANASSAASEVDQTAHSREILVTFVDAHIQRPPSGTPGRYYGGGSDYRSSTWARRISAGIARDHGLVLTKEWPMQVLGVHCVVYTVPGSAPLEPLLMELQRDERIDSAQPMNRFRVMHEDPYRPLQASLHRLNVDAAHRWSTGKGVTIAVIDSGIDRHHPDLAGQLEPAHDFTGATPTQFDTDVHGTAVAGVIAANGNNDRGIIGVAPAARLIPLKACWAENANDAGAICDTFTLAQALEAAIREGTDIINLSLTGPADPLLEALLQKAIERNIIVVIAQPGTGDLESSLAAAIDAVIHVRTVGGNRRLAGGFAVTAPGEDVLTTFPGGRYDFISGSSFAAAHVSGVIALLRALQPTLTAARIEGVLQGSANDGAPAAVNACEALARLRGEGECGSKSPVAMVSQAQP